MALRPIYTHSLRCIHIPNRFIISYECFAPEKPWMSGFQSSANGDSRSDVRSSPAPSVIDDILRRASLSQLCKDNSSESALDLRKNLMEYYHDLHKALQSWYETLNIKEEKPEESATLGNNKENKTSNVQVDYRLKTICDNVDGRGLVRYIVLNMKDEKTVRKDLSVAFSNARNPAKLALTALQGYHFYQVGIRRACVLILEYLYPIFGSDDSADVPLHVKNSAREIAKDWRNRMNRKCALDSQAFLQLLISFRIAADYEKDELLEILIPVSSHKQAPELCRSLGLSPDADFVYKVSKNLGQLDALRFAHAFGMMDKVDPVDLLTSLLIDVEKDITEMRAHDPDASKLLWNNADINKKIRVLKSVFNHVKMYGLQCDSFKANLLKEIKNLENEEGLRTIARKRHIREAAKENATQKEYEEKAAEKKAQEKEDREKAGEKKAQEKEDVEKAGEKKAQEKEDREKAAEKKVLEKEDQKKAAEKMAKEKEDGEKEDRKKAAQKNEQLKTAKRLDRLKSFINDRVAAKEKAKQKGYEEKAAEEKAREKEDEEKAGEKAQEKEDGEKAGEKAQEKEDGEKAAEKKAQEKEDGKKAAEKKAQEKEEGNKAAERKAQEKEDEESC